MKIFRRTFEGILCNYAGMTSVCNETASRYYANYFGTDIEYWGTHSQCGRLFWNIVVLLRYEFSIVNCKRCNMIWITSYIIIVLLVLSCRFFALSVTLQRLPI